MPKDVVSSQEWKRRISEFAHGRHTFGRGQRPPKTSHWGQILAKVEACPRHKNSAFRDMFGRVIICNCTWHTSTTQRQPSATVTTAPPTATVTTAPSVTSAIPTRLPFPSVTVSQRRLVTSTVTSTPPVVTTTPHVATTRIPVPSVTVSSRITIPSVTVSVRQLDTSTAPPVTTTTTSTVSSRVPAPSTSTSRRRIVTSTVTTTPPVVTTAPPVTSTVSSCVPAPTIPASRRRIIDSVTTAPPDVTATPPVTSGISTDSPIVITATPSTITTPIITSPIVSPILSPTTSRNLDLSSRLPKGWLTHAAPGDVQWIARQMFTAKGDLKVTTGYWHTPPEPGTVGDSAPSPTTYFCRRLFLWMPRRFATYDFKCVVCHRSLRSKGLYNRLRLVLDLNDYYYLAAEYLECGHCTKTVISWDQQLLAQLPDHLIARFPIRLTYKYACDIGVIALLRSRTLGNSPSALQHTIMEQHSEEWMRRHIIYLAACATHTDGRRRLSLPLPTYAEAPPLKTTPTPKWYIASYVRDVYSRLPQILASLTSTFGAVLKIDSTKKICKKLQGEAAGTASWCTNVGNEKGEVLMSVLTTSESTDSLRPMAEGIISRYQLAQVDPPSVLYTDRECCRTKSHSKLNDLFKEWPRLQVRLDLWHWMRRIAAGCTTESHSLYGVFMSRLTACVFEWDSTDYAQLRSAKFKELVKEGVRRPKDSAITNAITKKELARHCRRRTKTVSAITDSITNLIDEMLPLTDDLGVPVLRDEVNHIWAEQRRHVPCIRDVPDVPLYVVTGSIVKGGVTLPVYRCARGSTSLESFHLHLNRFIPGTSANLTNFQAYLVDGLARWNAMRSAEAISDESKLRSFDVKLHSRLNILHTKIHGRNLNPHYQPPSEYTGEKIGIQYLLQQTDPIAVDDLDREIDNGADAMDIVEDDTPTAPDEEEWMYPRVLDDPPAPPRAPPAPPAVPTPSTSAENKSDSGSTTEVDEDDDDDDNDDDAVMDHQGIPGWDKVNNLARYLLENYSTGFDANHQTRICQLYDDLAVFDKRPIKHSSIASPQKLRGRFARGKRGNTNVDVVKRKFMAGGTVAAQPNRTRLMEAIFIHLSNRYTNDATTQISGVSNYMSRWKVIETAYNELRQAILVSVAVMEKGVVLLPVNTTTILKWYKNRAQDQSIQVLIQGRHLPGELAVTAGLPEPREPPTTRDVPVVPHIVPQPEDRSGMAAIRKRPAPSATVTSQTILDTSTDLTLVVDELTALADLVVPPRPKVSRTTEWRQRKKADEAKTAAGAVKTRKVYTCRICGEPMASGDHTQFRGQRFCPNEPGALSKAEWLALKRAEAAVKKAAMDH